MIERAFGVKTARPSHCGTLIVESRVMGDFVENKFVPDKISSTFSLYSTAFLSATPRSFRSFRAEKKTELKKSLKIVEHKYLPSFSFWISIRYSFRKNDNDEIIMNNVFHSHAKKKPFPTILFYVKHMLPILSI